MPYHLYHAVFASVGGFRFRPQVAYNMVLNWPTRPLVRIWRKDSQHGCVMSQLYPRIWRIKTQLVPPDLRWRNILPRDYYALSTNQYPTSSLPQQVASRTESGDKASHASHLGSWRGEVELCKKHRKTCIPCMSHLSKPNDKTLFFRNTLAKLHRMSTSLFCASR